MESSEEVRTSMTSYKVAFLLGGASFAVASYFVGTVIYQAELRLSAVPASGELDVPREFANIFRHHLFTFVPWVLGTTAVSVLLGFLYDRQATYRRRAEAMAVTDSLTLVYNHRFFAQELAREVARAGRPSPEVFSLLVLDVDDFKRYNDTHGHLAGDDVLRSIAIATRSSVRRSDLVARYGGEEFVVLLPGVGKEEAAIRAERIRYRVETNTPATVSIGVASYPEDGTGSDDVFKAADGAMYVAKSRGKNCVVRAARSLAAS